MYPWPAPASIDTTRAVPTAALTGGPTTAFPGGKPTYRCGDCHYHFTPGGNRTFHSDATKARAIALYCKGSSRRAISRGLAAPLLTVYTWVKKSPASIGAAGVGPALAPAATGAGAGGGVG